LLAEVRHKLTQKVAIGYGSMESNALCRASYADLEVHEDSVGFPVPGVSVKIVLADGQVAPRGEKGVIGIQSDMCINGYLLDDALNAKHFKDGWFYPGDVGTLTDSGMLLYHGRADDMMIMNGINIFPAEIEKIASEFPGVLECAAFPMRSYSHGDIPALAVVSSSELNMDDLKNFCKLSLGIRAPRKIVYLEKIPRNPQGKIIRIKITKKFSSY
jgi:acyl-coenzyme A synthetase/AMP-(fatty) acid ligase